MIRLKIVNKLKPSKEQNRERETSQKKGNCQKKNK